MDPSLQNLFGNCFVLDLCRDVQLKPHVLFLKNLRKKLTPLPEIFKEEYKASGCTLLQNRGSHISFLPEQSLQSLNKRLQWNAVFYGIIPHSHKRGFEEHDLLRIFSLSLSFTAWYVSCIMKPVISWNDWNFQSFCKMSPSLTHLVKWLKVSRILWNDWRAGYSARLFDCLFHSVTGILWKGGLLDKDPLLVLQWLLGMALDFESSFRKELYRKCEMCPKCMIPREEYCPTIAEIKKGSQDPKSKSAWILPACRVSFKEQSDFFFFFLLSLSFISGYGIAC